MKKIFLPLIFIMLFCTQSYAIETIAFKDSVVAMTATTNPAATDIIPIVVSPATTPLMRKVTVANLRGTYNTIVAMWTTCTGYLKSDGTCDTPGGTLTGTGTNHYWPYWTGTSTLGAKSITASKPVCSDSSGDPAVCAGTEGVWQAALTRPVTGPASPTANSLVKFTGTGQGTDNAAVIIGTLTDGKGCTYASSGTLLNCNTDQPAYTEPGANGPLCRTGASAVGACSNVTDISAVNIASPQIYITTSGLTADKAYYMASGGSWTLADANGAGAFPARCYAIAATKCLVMGVYTKTSHGFTVGANLYLSEAVGDLTNSAPTTSASAIQAIGFAIDANTLFIHVSPDYATAD